MTFCVDSERNLFTQSKDRNGQQQSETSESMILHFLKKMPQEINGHWSKL